MKRSTASVKYDVNVQRMQIEIDEIMQGEEWEQMPFHLPRDCCTGKVDVPTKLKPVYKKKKRKLKIIMIH